MILTKMVNLIASQQSRHRFVSLMCFDARLSQDTHFQKTESIDAVRLLQSQTALPKTGFVVAQRRLSFPERVSDHLRQYHSHSALIGRQTKAFYS